MPTRYQVSISTDPALLDVREVTAGFVQGTDAGGTPILHPALVASRAAMESIHGFNIKAVEAANSLMDVKDDPVLNKRLRLALSRTLADSQRVAESALQNIEAHRKQATDSIELALQLSEHRGSVVHSLRAADVRASLRAMSKAERLKELRAAINAGRVEAIASVLSADPLASGLTAQDLDGLMLEASTAFAPADVRLRSNLDRIAHIVSQAAGATSSTFNSLIGKGTDNAARAEASLLTLEGATVNA